MKIKPQKLLGLSLFALLFIALLGFDIYRYVDDLNIQETTSQTVANITSYKTTSRVKKGVKIVKYHFEYQYLVEGQVHTGRFSASENNAEPFVQTQKASIRFSKARPDISFLDNRIAENITTADWLWKITKYFFIAGVISFLLSIFISVKIGWIKPEEKSSTD